MVSGFQKTIVGVLIVIVSIVFLFAGVLLQGSISEQDEELRRLYEERANLGAEQDRLEGIINDLNVSVNELNKEIDRIEAGEYSSGGGSSSVAVSFQLASLMYVLNR